MKRRASTHAALALALASSIAFRAAGQSPSEGTSATASLPDSRAPGVEPARASAPMQAPPRVRRARPKSPYPADPVEFKGEAGQELSIIIYPAWADVGEVPPIVRCRTPCTLYMVPARYRVWVDETPNTLGGDRVITVDGPAYVLISPDAKWQRTIGLVLGLAGPALIVGSLGVWSATYCYSDQDGYGDQDSACTRNGELGATIAALMLVGGLAITAAGWVMYGRSKRPNMEVLADSSGGLQRSVSSETTNERELQVRMGKRGFRGLVR